MKKEYLLLFVSTCFSFILALTLFRFFFPQLLGVPTDMQVVQLDRKLPPFFEGIFRQDDLESGDVTVKDPVTNVRGRPLYPELNRLGPHDLLGFRNRTVPNIADVITIGDSLTYGINALADENWPNVIASAIAPLTVYNMSIGGFSAPQYLSLFQKALYYKPQVVVIAFYSGNDPLEAFITSYSIDYWKDLRPDPKLSVKDGPKIVFPPPKEDWWPVTFQDGSQTIFTPKHRLLSHLQGQPSTAAGYEIIFSVLKQIAHMAERANLPVLVTVLPTKELAFQKKITAENIKEEPLYTELVKNELDFIDQFQKVSASLAALEYVPLVDVLQRGVASTPLLYPPDRDGHPLPAGYTLIAESLFRAIAKHIKKLGNGLYKVTMADNSVRYFALQDNKRWQFSSLNAVREAGLAPETAQETTFRYLEPYPIVRSY